MELAKKILIVAMASIGFLLVITGIAGLNGENIPMWGNVVISVMGGMFAATAMWDEDLIDDGN